MVYSPEMLLNGPYNENCFLIFLFKFDTMHQII